VCVTSACYAHKIPNRRSLLLCCHFFKTGNYVANRVSDKITQITDHIWICRSGSAADTQAISDYLKYYLHMHSIELDTPPLVKTAAALAQQICYNNKEHLLAGLIIGGWDPINGGQVYNISLGGSLVRQPFAMSGSGSTYIYGYCDAEFRPKMTQEECFKFVRNGA
jgi:20S proteasome subunit beta 1